MLTETNARRSIEEKTASVRTPYGKGPSLPSGPRDDPSLRKRPSLTTLSLPNFSGMRPPSQPLLNAFAALLARLPQENRDLLRTVIDLINFVASRKEIRMPLSNLTVVLCPTLNMNPPMLRVLCEADGIWNGPPEGWEDSIDLDTPQRDLTDPLPSSGQEVDTDEPSSTQGDLSDQTSPMEPTVGAWSVDEMHEDDKRLGPALDDHASYVSTGDSRPSTPAWGKGSPLDPWTPPALTCSSDSLTTPSMSSEAPSIPQVTAPTPLHHYRAKPNLVPSTIPDFVRTSPSPSPCPRPATHPPVAFPQSQTAPTTPSSPRFPSALLHSESNIQNSRQTRVKRPSLTALFSKKSISSLRSSRLFSSSSSSSPYFDARDLPSRSSPGSPRTPGSISISPMISAPSLLPRRSSSSPPLLNTAIDSSSLSLALGLNADQAIEAEHTDTESHASASRESLPSLREADTVLQSSRTSPITPVTSSHLRSKSELPKLPLSQPEPLQPQLSEDSFVSVASDSSYPGLSFLDDHIGDGVLRDDWARNVFNDLGWNPTAVERGTPGRA
jgi:RhoGAP domain